MYVLGINLVSKNKMYSRFFDNVAKHIVLSEEEKTIALSLLQVQSVVKNYKLLTADKICRNFYFVDKGCLRLFSCDDQGQEHNVLFAPEDWWITDIASFSSQSLAYYSISALEDSHLFYFSYQNLEKLYLLVPKFERFFRILIQNGFNYYQNQITANISQTAEDRYDSFQKTYPNLEQRISQKQIATFLGITPIFLSRIRKRKFGKTD